jgi:hypothetical protein
VLHGIAPWREPVVIFGIFLAARTAKQRTGQRLLETTSNALLIKVLRDSFISAERFLERVITRSLIRPAQVFYQKYLKTLLDNRSC